MGLQRKLTIGPSTDLLELEADRIADQVMSARPHPAVGGAVPRVQRYTGQGTGNADTAPASIDRALASPGRPLHPALQEDMGRRFGFDFSRVRVHLGAAAERSARDLNADAYTVGHDIVFGTGRFAPGTQDGRRLLAHELTHVAQQSGAGGTRVGRGSRRGLSPISQATLQRKGGTIGGFFSNIGRAIAGIFGAEPGYSDTTLQEYLKVLDNTKGIEGDYDSDNKARAVVRKWVAGSGKFQLTAEQMVLLIREMGTGWVGSEDQDAILVLLTHAQNGDLRNIFGAGQINPRQLESAFGGERKKRLLGYYDTRFRGGKAALYGGTVDPLAGSIAGSPLFAWGWSFFRGKLEDPAYHDDELAAELARLPDPERDHALKDLSAQRIRLHRAMTEAVDKLAAESDAGKKATLKGAVRNLERKRQRVDTVMQYVFKDIVKAEPPAVLLPKTAAPDVAQKAEIKKALKPDVRSVGGVALPFVRHIAGEPKAYDDKISDLMPTMIQGYWNSMVKDKEAAQHLDPTKVHKLAEFDSIANAAKEATDSVFGAYYSAAAHPPFRSDRPPGLGGRGQLHDLFADTAANLLVMGPSAKRKMAKALVFYFFQSDDSIEALNRHHNADPQFNAAGLPVNPEATLLDTIASGWVASAAHVVKLNEIDRNWDASADPRTHEVNLQVFKKPTVPEDRFFLWDMYQTLIHEYLHTLVDPAYGTFADSFGPNSLENNTLIEGVDSLLDEIVWQDARRHVAEPAIRAKVEGPVYSALPFDSRVVPQVFQRRYGSYTQAVKLINVVGIRNLYAAYFKGKVDLIKP